jgi:homoserine dehydrogenase
MLNRLLISLRKFITQRAGFAEADPSFDIQGIDTAHKLAVLSSIAFGGWVRISDIYREGIAHLDLFDLQLADREFGYGLKLLGIAKENNGKVEVRVHPAFLPLSHPFLSVKNEYNAISIVGDAVGDVMFYGKGAGQMPAASAVVSDLIFLARHVVQGTAGKLPYVTYDDKRKIEFLGQDQVRSKYYLRFRTEDRPGVLSRISGILGEHGVSIASVFQPRVSKSDEAGVPISLTTQTAVEGKVQKAIRRIDSLPIARSKTVLIRIEE